MDHQSLKVNATALRLQEEQNAYILIYNVNIPVGVFGQPNVIQRIVDLLEEDFAGGQAYYQISATYYLQNRVTGQERFWAGSFFPQGNARGAVANSVFLPLERDSLMRDLSVNNPEDAVDFFEFENLETAWELSRLESIVVNVNARVRRGHRALARRGLVDVVERRGRRRRNIEFLLP